MIDITMLLAVSLMLIHTQIKKKKLPDGFYHSYLVATIFSTNTHEEEQGLRSIQLPAGSSTEHTSSYQIHLQPRSLAETTAAFQISHEDSKSEEFQKTNQSQESATVSYVKPLQTVLPAGHPRLQKQLSHFNQNSGKPPVCPPSLPPQLTWHGSAGPGLTSRCTLVLPEGEQSCGSEQHNLTPPNRLNVRDIPACNKIMLHFFPCTRSWFIPVALSSRDGLEAFLKG